MSATNEMISLAISLHLFFIVGAFLVLIRLLFLLRSDREFVELSRIYDRWVIYHRALLGAFVFAGVVVMAVSHFDVRWQVWLMVAHAVHMLVMSIKEYTYYKVTSAKKSEQNEAFLNFSKRKYLIEPILLIIVSIVSYAVSI